MEYWYIYIENVGKITESLVPIYWYTNTEEKPARVLSLNDLRKHIKNQHMTTGFVNPCAEGAVCEPQGSQQVAEEEHDCTGDQICIRLALI